MAFVIAILVVVRDVLVVVLERTPAVEIVPEVVEAFDVFLLAVVVTEFGDRLFLAEASFGLKYLGPEFVEVARLCLSLLLRGRLDIGCFVDRVELAASDGVREDLGCSLNAFEEGVVLVGPGCSFLVGVMAENLLAIGTFDLVGCSLPAVFRES